MAKTFEDFLKDHPNLIDTDDRELIYNVAKSELDAKDQKITELSQKVTELEKENKELKQKFLESCEYYQGLIKELRDRINYIEWGKSCKTCAKVFKCGHDEHCNYEDWKPREGRK